MTLRENANELVRAVQSNDPQLVKSLLEKGFDPNAVNADGYTALALSLSGCQKFKDIINVLLEWSGTDVNQIDAKGISALNLAIEQNELPIITKIFTRGYINWKGNIIPSEIEEAIRLNRPNILLSMLVAINSEDKGSLFWRLTLIQILLVKIYQTTTTLAIGRFDVPNILKKYFDVHFANNAELIIDQILWSTEQGRNLFTLAVERNCHGIINYLLSLENVYPSVINEKDAKNEFPLSIALCNENLHLAEVLLQKGASPNRILFKKFHLNELIKRNFMVGIKLLIDYGADVNKSDPDGHTPLTQAVKSDNLALINYLLDKGADVNLTNGKGYSPLATSVSCSQFDVASLLIERGAKIDSSDELGNTPLITAVKKENAIAVRFLLQKGASINCPNNKGSTPIDVAYNRKCWDLVQLLRERGAHLNRQNPSSTLALPAIAKRTNESSFSSPMDYTPDLEMDELKFFLSNSESNKAIYNNRLLNTLIKRNCLDQIKLVMDHEDTDLNTLESGKHTPLTQAVKYNNLDVINYLLDKGADVNLMNGKRYTPLTTSIRYSNEIVASLLLEKGAEVDMCDGFGKTPLTFAIEKKNNFLVNLLLENGASINLVNELGYTPVTTAIKINSWEMVKLLKKRGADLNLEDANGHTPITFATALNLEQISIDLINKKCLVDVNSQGWFGSTALLNAIAHKNEYLVQFLIFNGADVGLVDWRGRRPMVEAVKADCLPILKALTSAARTEDDDGSDISFDWLDLKAKPQTPLSQAVALNNSEVVEFLLQQHAHTKNSGLRFEVMNEAIDNNDSAAVRLLLKNVDITTVYKGRKLLERAIQKGNRKLIDCIIRDGRIKLETILTLAITKCSLNIISRCMHFWGSDINCIDEDGFTPLTKSIECNNSTIYFLLAKGADVNQIDGHGFTPLTKALETKQLKLIELLIERGADVSKVDGKNVKPLSKAVDTNDQQIINYIFSHYTNNQGSADENPSCRICYETFEKVPAYSTKCGHLFCKICMERLKSTSSQCPVCRANIYYNAMHPVFF